MRWGLIVAGMVLAGLVIGGLFAPKASGAERVTPGPHEIVLIPFGKDYERDGLPVKTLIRLSGPYETRAVCKEAMKRLVVKITGAKLACFPVER